MNTFKIDAEGGQFVGNYTLVMTRENGVPTPIGIIIDENPRRGKDHRVQARFLAEGFTWNDEDFPSKAAAERAIVEHYRVMWK